MNRLQALEDVDFSSVENLLSEDSAEVFRRVCNGACGEFLPPPPYSVFKLLFPESFVDGSVFNVSSDPIAVSNKRLVDGGAQLDTSASGSSEMNLPSDVESVLVGDLESDGESLGGPCCREFEKY